MMSPAESTNHFTPEHSVSANALEEVLMKRAGESPATLEARTTAGGDHTAKMTTPDHCASTPISGTPGIAFPAPATEEKEARRGPELNPPLPVLDFAQRHTDQAESPADTVSGLQPDRCAVPLSQASAAMLPKKAPLSLHGVEENSGGPATSSATDGAEPKGHETPAACDTESAGIPLPADSDDLVENVLQLFEGGVGRPPDEWRIEEANRRQQILETYDQLLAQGKTKAAAVKQIGVGYATVWRWKKRFDKSGYNGLLPETEKCGRKTVLEKLGMTEEQIATAINEVRGANLDINSVTRSLRVYAGSDQCPPALAQIILDPNRCSKHALPPSLRAAAKISKPDEGAHAGPRTLSLGGIYIPRKMDVLPATSSPPTTPRRSGRGGFRGASATNIHSA
jgi:hypothetical protein